MTYIRFRDAVFTRPPVETLSGGDGTAVCDLHTKIAHVVVAARRTAAGPWRAGHDVVREQQVPKSIKYWTVFTLKRLPTTDSLEK